MIDWYCTKMRSWDGVGLTNNNAEKGWLKNNVTQSKETIIQRNQNDCRWQPSHER